MPDGGSGGAAGRLGGGGGASAGMVNSIGCIQPRALDLEAIGEASLPALVAVGVGQDHHLVAPLNQALRQLVDVALHAARVGVEEVRHHKNAM